MRKIGRKCYTYFSLMGMCMILLGMFPERVFASTEVDSGTYGENITWRFDNDGVLTISGNGEMPDASSTADVPWYDYHEQILSVVIQEGITGIGDVAFYNCSNLTYIDIPESVDDVGYYSFYKCIGLESIELPERIAWISEYAFYQCSNLKEINLPENLSIINWSAFARCSSLITVKIPSKVTYIDIGVFSRCTNLKEIEIPANVTLIDESAFYMCENLTNVYYVGTEEQWNKININANNECLTTAKIYCNSSLEDKNKSELQIFTQPQNQSVLDDEVVTFFIEATGNNLTYQWQYAYPESEEWANCYLTGYDIATLSVKAVPYRDGMQFRCIVSDAEGNEVTSDAAILTISKEPTIELKILTQPESKSVGLGEQVVFAVEAEGTGLTYQWEYADAGSEEWQNCYLSGYNTSTLNVKAVAYRDGMQFRCVIKDVGDNSVPSEAATLSISKEPLVELAILTQPEDQKVELNGEVSFTIGAEGTGLTYQWEYVDAGSEEWKKCYLSGYNTSTLSTKAVEYRDGMQFRCVVKDVGDNTVISDVATIIVSKEPLVELAILTQPEDQTVELNGEVSFTVEAEGTGLTYQWEYADAGSEEWKNCYLSGYNTSTLSVKAVVYRDGMQFRCEVKDVGDNSLPSESATLSISKEPLVEMVILTHPEDQTVELNGEVSFTIEAEGTGLTYQWEYTEPGSEEWLSCYLSGYDTSVLTMKAAVHRNGMRFRCVMTDVEGNSWQSESATLIVVADAV